MLIVTDLDGTILPKGGKIDDKDRDALRALQKMGHVTAIATGRLFDALMVTVPADFPVDYIVFSAGNGVVDWRTKQILMQRALQREKLRPIIALLEELRLNFAIFENPPRSKHLYYRKFDDSNLDLNRLLRRAEGYTTPLTNADELPEQLGQMLVVFKSRVEFERVKAQLSGVHVVLSTSPIDDQSLWMEIFDEGVNKALGVEWISNKHSIEPKDVVAFGNDYNDLSMLHHAGTAYVVKNAPLTLKRLFKNTRHVTKSGVSYALRREFPELSGEVE